MATRWIIAEVVDPESKLIEEKVMRGRMYHKWLDVILNNIFEPTRAR